MSAMLKRPWWVRQAVPARMPRRAAIVRNYCTLLCGVVLFVIEVNKDRNGLLSALGLVAQSFALFIWVAITLWIWLAVRWLDRNDKWQQQ